MKDLFSQCTCVRAPRKSLGLKLSGCHLCSCRAHQREALNEGSILAMYMRTYVCTCLSRSGMSNFHLLLALTCTLRNSWVTCTAAVSPQRTCFAESSTERSRRFVTLRKRKLRTKSMYKRSQEDKKRTRQSANGESSQARYMLWRVFTSQVHVVESLHKPDIHFHV